MAVLNNVFEEQSIKLGNDVKVLKFIIKKYEKLNDYKDEYINYLIGGSTLEEFKKIIIDKELYEDLDLK